MVINNDVRHIRWDDLPKEKLTNYLDRRIISGEKAMLTHVYMKKGCVVPMHSHENEQITYILSGALKFWMRLSRWWFVQEKYWYYLRMCRTRLKLLRIRSTWTFSLLQGATGLTVLTITFVRSSRLGYYLCLRARQSIW